MISSSSAIASMTSGRPSAMEPDTRLFPDFSVRINEQGNDETSTDKSWTLLLRSLASHRLGRAVHVRDESGACRHYRRLPNMGQRLRAGARYRRSILGWRYLDVRLFTRPGFL